jgi:hypothetical protein
MENASKALIIAGAILISIILIGIGIMVINAMNPVTDEMGDLAGSTTIQSFNSKFDGYAGMKTASDIKSLISVITANNGQNATRAIKVTSEQFALATGNKNKVTTGLGAISAAVNTQRRYQVTIEDLENGDGFYDTITIIEQQPTTSTPTGP